MMKKIFYYVVSIMIAMLLCDVTSAQVGIGTATPNPSAQLDISSTTKGTLITRMTTAQRNAISNPAVGLLVFDLDKRTIYMFDGTKWHPLMFTTSENKLPPSPIDATAGANDDWFGYSVSISGDYAIVGAPNYDEGASNQGAAYIFLRVNGSWIQQARLIASNWGINDNFGLSVGISGDYAVVGSPWENVGPGDQGRAYVFHRSGTVWSMQAFFTPGDGALGDRFGYSVSISGDYVIVGSPFHGATDVGAAYLYFRGGGWIPGHGQSAKFTASDGLANDFLGYSVSIDGDYVIVGAYGDDGTGGADQGSAYMFFKGTGWMQLNHFHQKITASEGAAGDNFGYSVCISGAWAVVGAYLDDQQLNSNHGSAYIFFRSGSSWGFYFKLIADDGQPGDLFGKGVTISGDYIGIGAYSDFGLNSFQGSAYIYKRVNTIWNLIRKAEDDNGQIESRFGYAIAASGFNVIIGAYLKNLRKGQAFFLNIE